MHIELDFDSAAFDVKCKKCKNVYVEDEVIIDDSGKLLCPQCNEPTEWKPTFEIKRPKIQ
jgi:Zn finger protein HypA/HybF involved in hydrogenase expression